MLLINRVNRDALENVFAIYRRKGAIIQRQTGSNCSNSLMKPSKFTNCNPDEDEVADFAKSTKGAVSRTS